MAKKRFPEGTPLETHLKENVAIDGKGCWVWQGSVIPSGYGQMSWGGRIQYVHRLSYECFKGKVPDGLQLDHLCRNRACLNPEHLEPVTARINVLRGEGITAQNAKKTHCPEGHEYAPDNLVSLRRRERSCKLCALLRAYEAAIDRYVEAISRRCA